MRLYYISILIVLMASVVAEGQSGNYSSLPMFNQMYYNPGYAGDGNDIEARVLVREQWMGMPGAPRTQTFNVDAPFKLFNQQHGVGLSIVNDGLGNFSNTELNISYAYRKSLIQGELGLGLGLNMVSHSFESDWLFSNGETTSPDGSVPMNADQQPLLFDANLGVYYNSDNLYFSISTRNLLNTKVEYVSSESNSTTDSGDKQLLFARQVYFATGYDYQLANPMFSFEPGVFIATDFTSTQMTMSGIINYNKRFFGGLSYKGMFFSGSSDAVIALAGVDLPGGIQVAVSYDMLLSRIIKFSSGSFEFMAGYKFNLDMDKDNRKYKSVRFL